MIEIEHLSKRFGDFMALHDVHLTVQPGEILGFLGPNGAGKTTTIRIIAGLMRPTAGTVRICGHDIQGDPERAKALLGVIPDRPFLYEKLTPMELLEFVGGLRGMDSRGLKQRAEELLGLFGLREWKGELIEQFSHGMRQRLVMSAALLHEPRALVVDEPMVGLDPRGARLVKEILRREAGQRGTSIFMSTHTLEVAEEVCDRIAIIHQGRIIAVGTPLELQRKAGEAEAGLEAVFLRLTGGEDVQEIVRALRMTGSR